MVLEWSAPSLQAHGCQPTSLLGSAARLGYDVFWFSPPLMVPISNSRQLLWGMRYTYNFVLLPTENWLAGGECVAVGSEMAVLSGTGGTE